MAHRCRATACPAWMRRLRLHNNSTSPAWITLRRSSDWESTRGPRPQQTASANEEGATAGEETQSRLEAAAEEQGWEQTAAAGTSSATARKFARVWWPCNRQRGRRSLVPSLWAGWAARRPRTRRLRTSYGAPASFVAGLERGTLTTRSASSASPSTKTLTPSRPRTSSSAKASRYPLSKPAR